MYFIYTEWNIYTSQYIWFWLGIKHYSVLCFFFQAYGDHHTFYTHKNLVMDKYRYKIPVKWYNHFMALAK